MPPHSPDPYVDFLRSLGDAPVHVHPYLGNAGDELIFQGTAHLLDSLRIRTTPHPEKAAVILWPGGNPTMWRTNLRRWKTCWNRWPKARFVVGPATFQGDGFPWRRLLQTDLPRNAVLFARDPASYAQLQALALPDSVFIGLSHDPALQLLGSQWIRDMLPRRRSEVLLAAFRKDHESNAEIGVVGSLLRRWPLADLGTLYFRHGVPSANARRLRARLSKAPPRFPVVESDLASGHFDGFVDGVLRAAEIHTDRLHTLILGCLLEKPVVAYPTAYGKLEQVHRHSLASWASVTFVTSQPDNDFFHPNPDQS